MTLKELIENKYTIQELEAKKPTAHYDFIVTNAIYNVILVYDIIYKYGDNYIIYKPVSNIENKPEGKLKLAKITDKNTVNIFDINNKRHCISVNQIYRY